MMSVGSLYRGPYGQHIGVGITPLNTSRNCIPHLILYLNLLLLGQLFSQMHTHGVDPASA